MTFFLLSLLGYLAVAALAVTPGTHTVRVVLWPVVVLCALRAAVSVDLSPGDPDRISLNSLFLVSMFILIARTFHWILKKEQLVRHLHPANGPCSTIMDALDLATTLRGYGWDWSRGVYIPPETRPTNRGGFVLHVVLSATVHSLLCKFLRCAIQSFSPTELAAPTGASIFDESLPFHLQYLRASVISLLAFVATYASVQVFYDACTLVGVLVFWQDPARWPSAFDAPWRATSLHDFWGRRWHQFWRHLFITFGGYPFSVFLGKPGFIIGTFLLSGLYHYVGIAKLNDDSELWRMLVGFGMMAPGILAEWAFKQCTGRKVGGVVGRIWTIGWMLLWGNVIIDGLARAGVFGHFKFSEDEVLGQEIVQGLVVNFDTWLHTVSR